MVELSVNTLLVLIDSYIDFSNHLKVDLYYFIMRLEALHVVYNTQLQQNEIPQKIQFQIGSSSSGE